jgi:hypothetical protein
MQEAPSIQIHFSEFFAVGTAVLEGYGAFNVSLINDLPLFIDPFLLFNSKKPEYQQLHEGIIRYLRFLRDKSLAGSIVPGLLRAWFTFPEVKQNWLGYSLVGNAGSGLGMDFAQSLHANLHTVFATFGNEEITRGTHLEKLCLIEDGIGRDNISDFTANLVKEFLLSYTEGFAQDHLHESQRRHVVVPRVRFNYETETWESGTFDLPWHAEDEDFVLLTPRDILTKDDVWIGHADLYGQFERILAAVPNDQLRWQINNYFSSKLAREPDNKDYARAVAASVRQFPILLEHYIRLKEDRGDEAVATSSLRVLETETIFIRQLNEFTSALALHTGFYGVPGNTYDEARLRVLYLKDVIENKGGHRIFYNQGEPIRRESDVHILFRLCWLGTPSDVSQEVNDGRGPADYKISRGALDKTIVEFKLASNRQLKRNLEKQAELYQKASDAGRALKVIVYFSGAELDRVRQILRELRLGSSEAVILIDAGADEKPSASKA